VRLKRSGYTCPKCGKTFPPRSFGGPLHGYDDKCEPVNAK
jgi:transposase-like protein